MPMKSNRRTWMTGVGVAAALALGAGGATVVSAQPTTPTVDPGPPSSFSSITPLRILDTRDGTGTEGITGKIGPNDTITVDLTEILAQFDFGVVDSVVLNVGVEDPSMKSYVAVIPQGAVPGATSTVNFDMGQTIANQAIVSVLPTDDTDLVHSFDVYNSVGETEVFIDLLGAYGFQET